MNNCIFISAVNKENSNFSYAEDALAVMNDYTNKRRIPLYICNKNQESLSISIPDHPSWYQLMAHKITGYQFDFILAWNLDLLPVSSKTDVFNFIDKSKICLYREFNGDKPSFPYFKYNCGLIGMPLNSAGFFEDIYNRYCSNPNKWPSYEQYYVNQEIGEKNIDVFEMPEKFNHFYNKNVLNTDYECIHYTCNVGHHEKQVYIAEHKKRYFEIEN